MSLPARTVLVNYRNMDKTIACIRALEKMSVKPECVYLIDNASTQESRDLFEKAFPQSRKDSFEIECTWNEKNIGFAAACNQGIRAALEDGFDGFIWLLNNDTEPEPDALKELLATAESSHAGITGSQIVSPDGKFLGGVGFVDSNFATVRRATSPEERGFSYIEGSSFLISPECLRKTGELSENTFCTSKKATTATGPANRTSNSPGLTEASYTTTSGVPQAASRARARFPSSSTAS